MKEVSSVVMRLINQMWKLIPMRENEEDWKRHLESVIIEVAGLTKIFSLSANLIQLLAKLNGLLEISTDFSQYRKTVFESISLLQGFRNE